MNDLISRQAAIKAISTSRMVYGGTWGKGLSMAVDRLRELPPAQQWIPCSKRLPEDWVPVLVTLKRPESLPAWIKAKPENYFHIVDIDVCENGEWTVNKKNVTAWMPLPDPYIADMRGEE